jgi:hypothetical protein
MFFSFNVVGWREDKMKKGISILVVVLILFFGAAFVLFTNTGIGLLSLIQNWKGGDPPIPPKNEVVMPPNATIEAMTETGTIVIKSGKGLKRYYTWDGITRSVVMWPRPKRWYGSLGIYYPGPGSHWLPKHNGISRGVLQEGQRHYKTVEGAMVWIKKCSGWNPTVYRDDGLLVAYGKTLGREQLNVGVWQILINGKKPDRLEESNNAAIRTSWGKTTP